MNCERCGYTIEPPYKGLICPRCGSAFPRGRNRQTHEYRTINATSAITQPSKSNFTHTFTASPYTSPPSQSHKNPHTYQTPASYINARRSNREGLLLLEGICSLLGIFGVGWFFAGEPLVGIGLLIASICLYWPVMIMGTILTLGLGLICLGPFAVGVVICNFFLFYRYIKHHNTL